MVYAAFCINSGCNGYICTCSYIRFIAMTESSVLSVVRFQKLKTINIYIMISRQILLNTGLTHVLWFHFLF